MQNVIRKFWCQAVLAIWLGAGLTLVAPAKEAVLKTEANVMVELTFTATRVYPDPFNEVTLDAIFCDPKGRELRVPAFWAGTNVWKVRYASPVVGTHRFRSECSEARDQGLHGVKGAIKVAPYAGKNPLLRHGALRVAADQRHFAQADGTPFFWLGDTWWMGLCQRLRWPEEFQTLAADRRAKGFNVVQIVAGLYPDMPAFDERGANEAGFPWERDYARIRPEYFAAADQRIFYLVGQGFVPCIVGAWGYHLPWLGAEKMKQHWRCLIARWGALPVVWCAAGEGAMPFYLSKDKAAEGARQKREWTEVIRFIHDTDPFKRLVTIHPPQTARESVTDPGVLDFDMQQTGHGSPAAQHAAIAAKGWRTLPVMPVISGEGRYEALEIKPTLTADDARQAFWAHILNSGCAGHTYGANGIWQVNRREQPYGKSPGGNNWGSTPWDEAMRLPGSTQLALGKRLLEQYPWHHFTPHPEWVAFTSEAQVKLDGCLWIWFPESNPAHDAPAEKRYFRKRFTLPEGRAITRARLFASADDWFTARLNGEKIGAEGNWQIGKQFNDLARRLTPGTNVLAILAQNNPADVPANPAGLIACLEIRFADGETMRLMSDATWRSAKNSEADWDTTSFDDSAWSPAQTIASYGDPPWGKIGGQSEFDGPQAAGDPSKVRIIWVPRSEPILVRNLGSRAAWTATYFDPVNGGKTPLPPIQASDDGSWTCPSPVGQDHDWILILEPKAIAK